MEKSTNGKSCELLALPPVDIAIMYGTSNVAKAIARFLMQVPGVSFRIKMLIRPGHKPEEEKKLMRGLEEEFRDFSALRTGSGLAYSRVIVTNRLEDLAGVRAIIITAGLSMEKAALNPALAREMEELKKAGKNPRRALLRANLPIAYDIAGIIKQYACEAVIIQVANPMSAILYLLYRLGFSPNQLVGAGNIVDLGRLEILFRLAFPDRLISLNAIGLIEHGAGIIVPQQSVNISGVTIEKFAKSLDGDVDKNLKKIEEIFVKLGDVALVYRQATDETPYEGPAAAVGKLILALLNPLYCQLLCVNAVLPNGNAHYGIPKRTAAIVPVWVGKGGILLDQIAETKLSGEEGNEEEGGEMAAIEKSLEALEEDKRVVDNFIASLDKNKKAEG